MSPWSSHSQLTDYTLYPQLDVLTRYSFALYKEFEHAYNFTMDVIITDNWGYYNYTTGHFNDGMYRALEYGEAELGVTFSRFFPNRLKVASFIPGFDKFRTCFIFRHPSTLAVYTAFAMPFSTVSWLCLFAVILSAGLLLKIVRSFDIEDTPPNDPSYMGSVLVFLGTFCQQGLYVDSIRPPSRVMTFTMEVASLLLYSYYGAEIVGFLLNPSPKGINTIDKLLASPIQMVAENLPYHLNHFTTNLSDKATKAYNLGLQHENSFVNLTHGIKMVKKGGYAMYTQDANMYALIDKTFTNPEKCSLMEIGVVVLMAGSVVRRNSPFRELIVKATLRLRENGMIAREGKRWHTQRPVCIGQEESTAVGFEATLIAQGIFLLGLAISWSIYFYERRMKKSKIKETESQIVVPFQT